MKKLRHSKFKNTGVLFELLVRQLTADVLNDNKSKVLNIINEHFKKNSILTKELDLYKALLENDFRNQNKADKLVETVIKARHRLDNKKLNKAKYDLIKDIQKTFDIEDFFKTRVRNYKEIASIYKVFEYNAFDNPTDTVNSKFTIIEHLTKKPISKSTQEATLKSYTKADKDLRLLTYKILVDSFNSKYSKLNAKQRSLLREYINNISNTSQLKNHIQKESNNIKNQLSRLNKKVSDPVVKIKLNEVVSMTSKFNKIRVVKDVHILSLLRYYELIKELKSLG
jgi:hypothetical protein